MSELAAVEWRAPSGLESGFLRFRPRGTTRQPAPDQDPNSLELWGFKKESGTTALLAAAVAVRLPHPSAGAPLPGPGKALEAAPAAPAVSDDHDTLLRRLRELGELRRDGVLTEEEFTAAKAAVVARLPTAG